MPDVSPTRHGPPACPTCGRPVARPGPCDAPACQTRARVAEGAALAARKRAVEIRRAEQAATRCRPLAVAAMRQLGLDVPAKVAVGPLTDRPLRRPEDSELQALAAHVEGLLAASFGPDPAQPRPPETPEPEAAALRSDTVPDDPPWVGALCVACRGLCCQGGRRSHAYLSRGTIDAVRHAAPDLTHAALRDAYLSALPQQAVVDSCLFHGVAGCTLPRRLRSDICNAYECDERVRLRESGAGADGTPVVAVAVRRDHHAFTAAGALPVRVVSATAAHGLTLHENLALPAMPGEADG
ncbi:hypothetical protein [Oceaniglobus roseus]|uniref:hypothetical protein n=1 Tax=Oceaniglobus roseus TaxID=1737570 RepID=UPI000C7F3B3B|nr:hypothetical protein [Kandeliimicrobium roseum]